VLVVSSFAEVGRYLQGTGRVVRPFTEDEGEGYLFEVRHAGHKLLFGARPLAAPEGGRWLGLTALVCPVARLDIRRALVANSELPVGALAIAGENVVLRQTLPLIGLRADHLERTITGLRAEAITLQSAAKLPPGTESDAPYAYVFR
jgi:hypothetical protein